jgi:CBS domain-containing membrane protein
VLDVSRADLQGLLHDAEAAAYRRTLGALRCEDIMSRHPVAVSRNSTVDQARHLMRQRGIKALPVIDRARHLVGIVTAADFVRDTAVDPALAVGEVMTRRVRVAGVHLHVIELLPLFSEGGHHHLPIVDDEQCLVGIVTQSDMVRALHRAVGAG